MTIRVLLFGHYKDACSAGGGGTFAVEAAAGITAADIARRLGERDARLSDLMARTRVAINAEFGDAHTVLSDGDEVAFLPPMSGG
jgi:molybdopterin converting factor small subunit